jgi:small neutral amino acid transporter SnatA (MarC family)
MTAFIGGIIALVIGVIGLYFWGSYFIKALMASLPIMFILGGLLATYLGLEEIKDKKAAENLDESPEDLKQEVAQLKEEIKIIKEDKK